MGGDQYMTLDGRIFRAIALAIGTPYYCYDAQGIRAHFRQKSHKRQAGAHRVHSFRQLRCGPFRSLVWRGFWLSPMLSAPVHLRPQPSRFSR